MYYLELTDNELKNLAGILGNFIGKNESNKDTKELVESARNIFKKGNSRRRILPRLFL